ncbi:MAG: T9SS type A sorting domain-containing protein [Bacteroidia bacterium]|nr:T9SS type A sorting domain-containing protein [Bacteroidia bacterium]
MKPLVSIIVVAFLLTISSEGLAQLSSRDYLPVPAGCDDIGPNLIRNPEFEEGNVEFLSSFLFRPDGVCYWGDYTIDSTVRQPQNNCYDVPATYIPSNDFPSYRPAGVPFNLTHIWAVKNRLDSAGNQFPGDGLFMIVDPCDPLGNSLTDSCSAADPTDGRIWQQTIAVCPGEDYAFSVFAKNIYASDAYQWPGAGVQPDFELSINGSPITNYFVDGIPGQNGSYELPQDSFSLLRRWYQISGVYTTPSGTDSVTLVIRNLVQGKDGNDLALDGLFFGLCGKSIELTLNTNVPQCDQLGNIKAVEFRANQATQRSGWRYYEWTKNQVVIDSGSLAIGDEIPGFVTPVGVDGTYFGDYQLITYTDTDPTISCANASQVISIIDSCDATFPVEMGLLTGSVDQRRATLKWETFSETDNRGFEIQHSLDNRAYEQMGFVEGQGTTTEINSYQFVTNKLGLGKHYFRLKQVDFNGRSDLSNTIAVLVRSSDILVDLFPNPARENANIKLQAMKDDFVKVELYSPLGQKVTSIFEGWIYSGQEVNEVIETASLPSGMYTVRLKGARSNETFKLMVGH